MKRMKKGIALVLALAMILSLCTVSSSAKTDPAGQTVGTVLFYITNSTGEEILASHTTVAQMEADMKAGLIDTTNHNYSMLDRYVTTVHQEAQGFSIPEYVYYAKGKSTLESIRNLNLTYAGQDRIGFWEIDQADFDDMDTYTYDELYAVQRYNFPLLYEYWDYRTQDYYDPAKKMSRDEVIDHIFSQGEKESVLLAVRAFSQRYMVTDDKYGSGDYNMEDCWYNRGLLDNQRAIRIMKPMTKEELYAKSPTASDTRYWVANIKLNMVEAPAFASLGKVAAPTASMTEDAENYYITFRCSTPGATILYNHNYISPSYTPSSEYTGGVVAIPKSQFPSGTVTMTCSAVKDGYTDAGVQTLTLTSSGHAVAWTNPYSDVVSGSWYYDYVQYVTENKLFDAVSAGKFGPDSPMTRAMLATALYRMAGQPKAEGITATPFTDVPPSADYADAVAWAYEKGIVNGMTATAFAPGNSITREQITTMFHRYAGNVTEADLTISNDLAVFNDVGKLSAYASDSMKWAVEAGLINGMTATTIVPQGTATRAQVAAMVQRLGQLAD